ncbi:hypothetical protein [Amycolatopsis suaedae]|uniref:Uncharacterized protein n=1 Tax=Amycolatopsis suaedae TaxID=2510978 RepID=A0A4Q7J625_9PSEU|nr:hypothetical protein [Amycolatopsis suaedae]RZQ62587.1 hypothetical protein EWH70_16570 [Amycolatopsis suaedae]
MHFFGIRGYEPRWLDSLAAAEAAHGDRLRSLTGRTLTRTWLVWDLDTDSWLADCPVVLDFDGHRAEINHEQFDKLSITWNSVDPTRPSAWTANEFNLEWREGAHPGLAALHGQTVRSAELRLYAADGAAAVSFELTGGRVTVYNALDRNGIELG